MAFLLGFSTDEHLWPSGLVKAPPQERRETESSTLHRVENAKHSTMNSDPPSRPTSQ